MLYSVNALRGFSVEALDGVSGTIERMYFDARDWAIRYFVVATGVWFSRRRVLMEPRMVGETDWAGRVFRARLSWRQLRNSPRAETVEPPGRRDEIAFYQHFGYPHSMRGHYPWQFGAYPAVDDALAGDDEPLDCDRASAQTGLRACNEVLGHRLRASGEALGRVDDLLCDSEDWAARFMVVETGRPTEARQVLLEPARIERVHPESRVVVVNATREQLESSPAYVPPRIC